MTLVVDASVIVKWLLNDPEREEDTVRATRAMQWILENRVRVIQPAHWLAEVAAVLARMTPRTAEEDVLMLRGLDLKVDDDPAVYGHACRLAIELQQHVFDTLYHAVALEAPDGILLTADNRYLRAGQVQGRIAALSAWERVRPS